MPIPLLFIAAGAGTALFGVGKGVKAGIDQKEASDTNKASEYKVEHAKNKVNESRKNCGTAIDKLGERKVAVLDGSIKKFISEFETLNHVELSESSGLNELQKLVLDKKSFSDLKDLQGMASSLAGGLASGAMAGALTAFGAYGAAGALATASTGTAIQTVFDPMIYQMTEIIKERGTDFRNFTEDERKVVASAMSLAGAIKAVLDTPILDEDGNLTKESGLVIESTQKKIESIVA